MKNIFVSVITATLLFTSCKQEKKETTNLVTKTQKINTDFDNLLKEYNERKLRLFPINATKAGDARYNDKFPNLLLTEYTYKIESFYEYFKSKLETYKNSDLSESQQMSKAVLAWDCDIALAQNSFKNDLLMPINQMWTINLTIGQFASGSSSQPFKTVVDYKNWLLRLDSYNNWLKSAKDRMQEGIKEGYILPKSLIKKVIPQFKVLANTTLKDHLFYTPIKNFPSKFSNEEKEELSKKYTNILNEKLIPSFKSLYNFLKTDYLKQEERIVVLMEFLKGRNIINMLLKSTPQLL